MIAFFGGALLGTMTALSLPLPTFLSREGGLTVSLSGSLLCALIPLLAGSWSAELERPLPLALYALCRGGSLALSLTLLRRAEQPRLFWGLVGSSLFFIPACFASVEKKLEKKAELPFSSGEDSGRSGFVIFILWLFGSLFRFFLFAS